MREAGSCYGHAIRTELHLEYLRSGGGEPLIVREEAFRPAADPPGELMLQWVARPGERAEGRLYRSNGTFSLWLGEVGWFRIEPERREIAVPPTDYPVAREAALWSVPSTVIALTSGRLPIHAASVDLGGQAILIGAPGKHGKTTLAASFLARGYRLLSEDISWCSLEDVPAVLPGPASLRVRKDVFERMTIPSTRVLWTDGEKVHLALEQAVRGDGRPVPLRGIVLLRPGEEHLGLDPASFDTAVRDLWGLASKIPTDEFRTACFNRVVNIVSSLPVFDLHRPHGFDRLADVIDTVTDVFAA